MASASKSRGGIVRASATALRDNSGEFQALGTSLFWAAWAYKNDRVKLERNLDFISKNGFDYIRVLGVVGRQPYWAGREVDWRWPDYDSVIAGLTDLAYDKYGLRIEWTLIGDGDQVIPNRADRFKLVDRFLAMSRGREQKIMHFEIANEAWQNGFAEASGLSQLRELSRYMKDRTEILVAASTPSDVDGDYCAEASSMYQNDIADMITFHFSRNVRFADGYWRPVRQPWEHCHSPVPSIFSNNEPIGPGSSVAQDDDPYRLVSAAILTYIANGAFYVYHTEAGVWGGKITEFSGKSDVYEYPSATAFRAMKQYLPRNLAAWTRVNTYNNPQHPFWIYADNDRDRILTESAAYRNGVERAYGAKSGSEFVVLPIGVRGRARFETKGDLEFDAIDPVSGEVKGHFCLRSGQNFYLSGLTAFVLKGRYNAACSPNGAGSTVGGTPVTPGDGQGPGPLPSPQPSPTSTPSAIRLTIGVVVGEGGKVVFPDGSECRSSTCHALFDPAVGVQIRAVADAGFRFDRWTIDGNCGETNASPLVRVSYPINCGANFVGTEQPPAAQTPGGQTPPANPGPGSETPPSEPPPPVVSPATCSARTTAALTRLYQAVLWRGLDAEASVWCEHIESRGLDGVVAVARALTESHEFSERIGPVHSRYEVVNRIYEQLLSRGIANDPDAISTWVERTPPYSEVVAAVIRYGGFTY